MNVVTISRDPFARHDVIRQRVNGTCSFCGNPAKFKYGHCPDAVWPRNNWAKGEFCGIACARAYHGGGL